MMRFAAVYHLPMEESSQLISRYLVDLAKEPLPIAGTPSYSSALVVPRGNLYIYPRRYFSLTRLHQVGEFERYVETIVSNPLDFFPSKFYEELPFDGPQYSV
jgi:hypothetical protein